MFVLCQEGENVTGEMQWSSLVSGWSVRPVEGSWNGDTLVMRDLRLSENRPQPGWMFCTVDRWELRRTGNRLEGTYDSAACRDHATVWLERMEDDAPAPRPAPGSVDPPSGPSTPDMADAPPSNVPSNVGQPPSPDVPSMDQSPSPAETPRQGGCGCTASGSSVSLLPLLAWLVVRRRR
jgi:hypothetical protein